MRLLLPATLVALIFAAAPALAGSAPLSAKADASAFPSAKAQIEKDLKDGKTYSELTRTQKDEVLAALERIEDMLAVSPTVAEMSDEEKVKLINDQEFVNTVLTQAREDSRLICTQERKTGSHRTTPRCRTVAENKRARDNGQELARRIQRSHMSGPGE